MKAISLISFASISPVACMLCACASPQTCAGPDKEPQEAHGDESSASEVDGRLPLCVIKDVDLPGNTSRFDYQDIDVDNGRLAVAHMGDSAVDILDLNGV